MTGNVTIAGGIRSGMRSYLLDTLLYAKTSYFKF